MFPDSFRLSLILTLNACLQDASDLHYIKSDLPKVQMVLQLDSKRRRLRAVLKDRAARRAPAAAARRQANLIVVVSLRGLHLSQLALEAGTYFGYGPLPQILKEPKSS
jgi:hypothetical protein